MGTDLSVFARTVQEAVSVPVYDINSLIAYAAFCVRRNQWVMTGNRPPQT